MPLKLNLKISNKAIYAFIGLIVIAVVSAGVYSLNVADPLLDVPDPGHALDSTQGYFEGDTSLRDSLGRLCQNDGTNCTAVGDNLGNHIATQNLSVGNNRAIDLSNPINNLDGANKQYVDTQILSASGLTCISKKCSWYKSNLIRDHTSANLPSCTAPACSGGWVSAGTSCSPISASTFALGQYNVVVGYCERWCCQ